MIIINGDGTVSTPGFVLELWLKPSSLSGLSNNDPISTWPDSSGNGRDATSTGGTRPLYRSSGGSNNKPWVEFDGADDNFILPNFLTGFTSGGHGFVVFRVDADPPATGQAGSPWSGGWGTGAMHIPFTDGNIYDGFGSNIRKSTGNPSSSLTSWRLYEVRSKAGEWTSWIDGTQHFTTASNTVSWGTNPEIGPSGAGHFLDGGIHEIKIYSGAPDATEIANYKSYLATEYSLTLA